MTATKKAKPRKGAGKRTSKRGSEWLDDRYFLPYGFWLDTVAGVQVSEETARRFSAVFACVKIIAESLASIPILTYRRLPRGKERADDHRVYKLLKLRPNRWQSSVSFRLTMFSHCATWGNAYAEIVRNPTSGEVEELVPLHPALVRPKLDDDNNLFYQVPKKGGGTRVIRRREMFHLLGLTDDGLVGYSPIEAMREGIGLGLAAETFGAAFFGNGATPASVIQMAGKIGLNEREVYREKIEEMYKGARKAGKVALLDSGMEWKQIGIPIKDAQYIEIRRFQIEEIARIYRVPPFMLQDHSRATFNNVEHLSINFVQDCLVPWARRFEDAALRDLLNPEAGLMDFSDEYFVEFLFAGLLRGDLKTRYEAFAVARQNGILSANEWREIENMNPIDGGDEHLVQVNMIPMNLLGAKIEAEMEKSKEASSPATNGGEDERGIRERFERALRSIWGRIVSKEFRAVKSAAKNKGEGFGDWLKEFVPELREFAANCLGDLADARVLDEYVEGVALAAAEWMARPAAGYARDQDEVTDYWTKRVLNYSEIHDAAA